MSVEREIGNLLHTLIQGREYDRIYPAKVKSVEGATCTVKLVSDGREFQNVNLSLVIENEEKEGLIITPVIDSQVLIANVNKYNWFVCQYSQIEKVTLNAADKIVINEGKNGGLVMIKELTDKINELVDVFNDHIHSNVITEVTGQATGIEGDSGKPTSTQSKLNREDYENENVTH